jgi:Caspase domain
VERQIRQALLIGVPSYPNDVAGLFPDLSRVVERDIALLERALRGSGYTVETLGMAPERRAARSQIRSAIGRMCCRAPSDGVVLVHFTGHGLSLDGTTYLVPADATPDWSTEPPTVDVATLLALDMKDLLAGSTAGTVLLTIDACRDGGTGAPEFLQLSERVCVVFGCGPGQTCGSDETEGSHFSRALANALDPETPPRTLGDVVTHTVRRTVEHARAAQHRQKPQWVPQPALESVEICGGRSVQESWTAAIGDTGLWAAARGSSQRKQALQQALAELAVHCARLRRTALDRFPDPWADDDYPVRVLTQGLRPLLAANRGEPPLDAGELAALIAAPFVREAVLAVGWLEAAHADPANLAPAPGADHERSELEHVHAAHSLIRRKGRELAARGREADARAVAAWLLHRHVVGKEALWDDHAASLLRGLASVMIGEAPGSARTAELVRDLVRACRQISTPLPQAHETEPAEETRWRVESLGAEQWRPRELAWLIALSGLLGADIRQLPGVLVDSVGVRDALEPATAVAALAELRWIRSPYGGTLDLDLLCPHPAVHAALETLTGWADEHVRRAAEAPTRPQGPLAHLPDRVTCRQLRPQTDPLDGDEAYGLPLMRFGLAEDEIRELLMGTQLYGDPQLALRELYQNALDACRYRQARLRYGELKGAGASGWAGRIHFRQGVDEDGRPYIECEDNGVGMGRSELRNTFSRAGRRFEQSREYRLEQACWRKADPDLRLYPNSRFGIGVFSYFMLADEVTIWTRRTDPYGVASGEGLQVDISSSGSLFRIRRNDACQPDGGSRVRLYLGEGKKASVTRTLRELVWVCEFAMRAEEGERAWEWEPGRLYYAGNGDAPFPVGKRFWWVPNTGMLLADGIVVETEPDSSASAFSSREPTHHPFGFVVDLREGNAPQLSASRTTLREVDTAHVDHALKTAIEDAGVPDWLSFEWLWGFAKDRPDQGVSLTRRLMRQGASALWRGFGNGRVRLADVGCIPFDEEILGGRERVAPSAGVESAFWAWRCAVWQAVGAELSHTLVSSLPLPESLIGAPAPEPSECQFVNEWSNLNLWRVAPITTLGEPRTFGTVLLRLRPYAILGFAVPEVQDVDMPYCAEFDSMDETLLHSGFHGALEKRHSRAQPLDEQLPYLLHTSLVRAIPLDELVTRIRQYARQGILDRPLEVVGPVPARPVTRADSDLLLRHQAAGTAVVWSGDGTQPESIEPAVRPEPDAEIRKHIPYIPPRQPLELRHVIAASGRLGCGVGEIVRRWLRDAEGRRATVADEWRDVTFSSLDAELVEDLYRLDPEERCADLRDTATAVRRVSASVEELQQRLTALAGTGAVSDRAPHLVEQWRALSARDMELLTLGEGLRYLVKAPEPIDHCYLLAAAACAGLSLGEAHDRIAKTCAQFGLRMGSGALPAAVSRDVPNQADVEACCTVQNGRMMWRSVIAPGHLVRHAREEAGTLGQTVTRLRRLSELGMPFPQEMDETTGTWVDHRPDPYDVAIFDNTLIGDGTTVTPIDLVRVAARFGWTLDRAWDRLALYQPLGLDVQVPRPDTDTIPRWQDLILLTEYFTGRAPAITDEVSQRHIAVAARETEQSTAWVRERLVMYAPLFGFTVPHGYPADPAPVPAIVPLADEID